jgi:hypothetical protein
MEDQEDNPKVPPKPEIYDDLLPIWNCFWFLSPARPQGMDIGAIPLSEIVTYWKTIGGVTSLTDLNERTRLVRVLDEAFLRISKERS